MASQTSQSKRLTIGGVLGMPKVITVIIIGMVGVRV